MKKAFLGLDPGKDGFITLLDSNGEYHFWAMPEKKVETGKASKSGKPLMKSVFCEECLFDLIFQIKEKVGDAKLYAGIEEIGGIARWGAANNFNFGYTAGLQKMIFIMLGAEITMVKPQKWQSFMYQGFDKVMVKSSTGKTMIHDTKATSKMVAQKLAPKIDFRKTERAKVVHDGKTDSFLICEYMRRIEK